MKSVYSAVRTGALNKAVCASYLKGIGIFRPKNPTASVGFEPVNLGTKGQHATRRPPKQKIAYIATFKITEKKF